VGGCTESDRWVILNKKLFSEVDSKDCLLVIVIVACIAAVSHFWITNPLGPARIIYPLQAYTAQHTTTCSSGRPAWLEGAIKEAVRRQGALSNQVVYIDPEGNEHRCENGWTGEMFFSPLLNEETRFRFASVSKLFTADAVIGLINEGRLSLDTKLVDIVPEALPAKDDRIESITIEHLLTHKAGFSRLNGVDPMFQIGLKPWCPYSLSKLAEMRLSFAPGEKTVYSNLGYCLLGVAVERVSGLSFREYLEREYDMKASGLEFVDGPYVADEVKYDFRNSDFYGEEYYKFFDFEALSSSAGLSGSAIALARDVRRMLRREPLTLLSGDMKSDCNPDIVRECYGYSFYRYHQPDKYLELYIQGGQFPGNTTLVIVDSKGGVFSWLSAGQALQGIELLEMYHFLYEVLEKHYFSGAESVRS